MKGFVIVSFGFMVTSLHNPYADRFWRIYRPCFPRVSMNSRFVLYLLLEIFHVWYTDCNRRRWIFTSSVSSHSGLRDRLPWDIWEVHQRGKGQWPWAPSYWYVLSLIPAWISDHIAGKMWDENTYPFSKFNGTTVRFLDVPYAYDCWLYCCIPTDTWRNNDAMITSSLRQNDVDDVIWT